MTDKNDFDILQEGEPTPAVADNLPEWQKLMYKHLQGSPMGEALQATPPTSPDQLEAARITPDTDGTPPPAALYINEKRVASVGDISLIVGPPKSRKTTFAAAVVNSLLTERNTEYFGTDLTKPKILYVDTEQSPFHAKRTFDRITEGANPAAIKEQLRYYALRQHAPLERLSFLLCAISSTHPDFVLLDGLADIMTDTNNKQDSSAIIGLLMAAATRYNCHICGILHTTHTNGSKGQGHAGSEAERKAETIVCVTKDTTTGGVTSRVEGLYTRNGDFAPLSVAQDGESIRVESATETRKATDDQLTQWAVDYVHALPDAASSYNTGEWATYICFGAEAHGRPMKPETAKQIVKRAGDAGLLQAVAPPPGTRGNTKYYAVPRENGDDAEL